MKVKILAGFYTHNKIRSVLLQQSVDQWLKACKAGKAIPIISSWTPLTDKCTNVISHYKNNGHLNIILQILQIVWTCKEEWTHFALCEHDCLYPENYFKDAAAILKTGKYTSIVSENHIGMRPNGYCEIKQVSPPPMSTMIISKAELLAGMDLKIKECLLKGQCCIEPDDRKTWFIMKRDKSTVPVIHVNMDMTTQNHHLTNHYDVYHFIPFATKIDYWGDYKDYKIYSDEETGKTTAKAMDINGYEIISATYGDIDSGAVIQIKENLRKLIAGKRMFASNGEFGEDPAPGIIKEARIRVKRKNIEEVIVFKENQEIKFS